MFLCIIRFHRNKSKGTDCALIDQVEEYSLKTELNWIELQLDFTAAGAKRATMSRTMQNIVNLNFHYLDERKP